MKYLLALIFISLLSGNLFPQQGKLSKAINYLSAYIASDKFEELSLRNNDLALVDSIYLEALRYNNYDFSETLFSLTFTAIPYKVVPIILPVLNVVIKYPLVSAGDSIFYKKNKNLPSQLYYDTPQNSYGDRDKLAHFFGSSFISYNSHLFDLGDLIGYFVEVFEEDFKVQSSIDARDLATNKLGNIFGNLLKTNPKILPSRVMLIPTLFRISINL